jgi:hypothetical protein
MYRVVSTDVAAGSREEGAALLWSGATSDPKPVPTFAEFVAA